MNTNIHIVIADFYRQFYRKTYLIWAKAFGRVWPISSNQTLLVVGMSLEPGVVCVEGILIKCVSKLTPAQYSVSRVLPNFTHTQI